jgi:hypothetical protein
MIVFWLCCGTETTGAAAVLDTVELIRLGLTGRDPEAQIVPVKRYG